MKNFAIWILLTFSHLLFAVPENELPHLWDQEINPHFNDYNHEFMTNAQGLKVSHYYKTDHRNSKTFVIVPGRTESSIKYAELLYDLRHQGFDIFIIDHQGQGCSVIGSASCSVRERFA